MTAQSGLGIGARLAGARERARLTVIQCAERLHLDPRVIETLEAERFEDLGASVYVRGHIRHYAELVGESPEELQGLYAASAHAAQTPDLTRVPLRESPVEASRALLVPAILVVSAIAVIGTVWWVGGSLRALSRSQRPGIATASRMTPPPPAPARAERPAATAATAAAADAAPEAAPAALRMHFAQDSWAEVYDASGKRLFYDVGSADSTRTVSGTPPLRVVLGNPAGVSLQLDGRPVAIPERVRPGERIELQIARSGRAASSHLAAAAERSARAAGGRAP